ncbi:MAG TPA: PilZ domain-containing protein [Candidatus Omnitrophota bacterium]|nr:PilZ domain-containing protein [Candidatus Omnitrophota bacterium]
MRERRQFVRVRCNQPLRYRELGGNPGGFRETFVLDISEGGMRFRTDRFIPVDGKLLLEMNLPPSQQTVKAVAKPAWNKTLTGFHECELGVSFLEIAEQDKTLVRDFVSTRAFQDAYRA